MTPGSQKYFAPSDIKPAVWTGSTLLLICTPPSVCLLLYKPHSIPPYEALPDSLLSQESTQQPAAARCPPMVTTDSLWTQSQGRGRRWLGRGAPKVVTIKGSTVSSGLPQVIKGSSSIWLHIKGLPGQWHGKHVWSEGRCQRDAVI